MLNDQTPAKADTQANKMVQNDLPFKDQKSADAIRKQLKDLGMKIGNDIQPVYKVQKLSDKRKLQEAKPP